MKTNLGIALVLIVILSSCRSTAAVPLPPTATLTRTLAPTATETATPEPTLTPEPSPTPVILPNVMNETFSDVSILSRQSFEFVMQGMAPDGWQSEEDRAVWIAEENQLKAKALASSFGTVFYYSKEIIHPNQGVYFTFKYKGTAESFTLGFDNVNPNGERVIGEGFRSVAMEMKNQDLIVYRNDKGATSKGSFKGNLRLLEDNWYDIALAFDEEHNFIIKIWQPGNNPAEQLTYLRKWEDFPDLYYFISWLSSNRELMIDDFTVFEFGEILQK
jgi:hypothetical protein